MKRNVIFAFGRFIIRKRVKHLDNHYSYLKCDSIVEISMALQCTDLLSKTFRTSILFLSHTRRAWKLLKTIFYEDKHCKDENTYIYLNPE